MKQTFPRTRIFFLMDFHRSSTFWWLTLLNVYWMVAMPRRGLTAQCSLSLLQILNWVRCHYFVSGALVSLNVMTVDWKWTAIGKLTQWRTVYPANELIVARLFQKYTLAVQAAIATLWAMPLNQFTYVGIEAQNILEIMLNWPLADGA